MRSDSDQYRVDIDGLRALAILLVIGFHVAPKSHWRGGFLGVDIFFVISGFLISTIIWNDLANGSFSIRQFWLKRVRRIFPALLVVLLAVLLLGWFALTPSEYASLGAQAGTAATFTSNIFYYLETGYFDVTAEQKPLLHLWSLAVEEQFYLLWPLLLVAVPVRHAWRGIALLIAASLAGFLMASTDSGSGAFYLPYYRLWELALGGLAAAFMRKDLSRNLREILSVGGATLIAVGCLAVDFGARFPGAVVALPTVGTAALLLAGPRAALNRAVFARAPLVHLGKISYPLYLWHWPLLSFYTMSGYAITPAGLAGIVCASYALSLVTYHLWEQRVRTWAGQKLNVIAASLAVAMGFIFTFGWFIHHYDGFPGRLPASLRPLVGLANQNFSGQESRYGTCMLELGVTQKSFAPDCVDADFQASPRSLLLWGDSYAAMLYPGLREVAKVSLAQFTVGACPPGLSGDRDECSVNNASVLAQVRALKPKFVLLAANWSRTRSWSEDHLRSAVQALKEAGVEHILLLGQFPDWHRQFPDLVVRAAMEGPVPEFMSRGLNHEAFDVDLGLSALAKATGIEFVAPSTLMCTQKGCRTHLAGGEAELVTLDTGHLTAQASKWFVEQLKLEHW